jgi:hypothetical protein
LGVAEIGILCLFVNVLAQVCLEFDWVRLETGTLRGQGVPSNSGISSSLIAGYLVHWRVAVTQQMAQISQGSQLIHQRVPTFSD